MKYISTRGSIFETSDSQAILKGIADDGGLFVPSKIPSIPNGLEELLGYSYQDLAFYILKLYLEDFPEDGLKSAISLAYDNNFSSSAVTPLQKVKDVFFLELFHGPTLAFKDVALSLLPRLLTLSSDIEGSCLTPLVLTATSGDTGKAALHGFSSTEGIKIAVFYPENGVSPIQKLQMITQEGSNAAVIGILGNFDQAQRSVKTLLNDKDLQKKLLSKGYFFSSANSINIGRLIPQIVYYFYSYLSLAREGEISIGDKINFAVPTGNFGDILAGYYAKLMGLPIHKLICASNENNVLYDFINSGVYDARRELKLTSSPSMDILISSNLERLLFEISGRDSLVVKNLMDLLQTQGFYEIPANMKEGLSDFYGGYSQEKEAFNSISQLYGSKGYLMDTHTAVAYTVYEKYRNDTHDTTKTVILSTASPFKFANALCQALSIRLKDNTTFEAVDKLSDFTGLEIPSAIVELKAKTPVHNCSCLPEDMKKQLEQFLNL